MPTRNQTSARAPTPARTPTPSLRVGIPETKPKPPQQDNPNTASPDSECSSASFQMSPTTTYTNITSAAPFSAADTTNIFPPAKSYAELIGQARKVNKIAVGACGLLDKIVKHLADTGPAIQAAEELEKLQSELQTQRERNNAKLRDLEEEFKAKLEEAIKSNLREDALKLVKEKVREKIKDSINKELHSHVQLLELSEQTDLHPKQMSGVKSDVANSEARARNAAVRTADENLRPLSLPDGKPHKQFPTTVHDLLKLSPNNLDTLLKEYEVTMPAVRSPAPAPAQSTSKGAPKTQTQTQTQTQTDGNSREAEKLNCFLEHIGVSYLYVVRNPSGKDVKGMGSFMIFERH